MGRSDEARKRRNVRLSKAVGVGVEVGLGASTCVTSCLWVVRGNLAEGVCLPASVKGKVMVKYSARGKRW